MIKRLLNWIAYKRAERKLMQRYRDIVAFQQYGIPLPPDSKPVEMEFRPRKIK
jgi:hypothetical protein